MYNDNYIQRFYSKLSTQPNGCQVWNGVLHKLGYGYTSSPYGTKRVHRIAYEIKYGEIPAGLFILHQCDNPACCNPEHLRAGTAADNMRDMYERGRDRHIPERIKLSPSDKVLISELLEYGYTNAEIREMAGYHAKAIQRQSVKKREYDNYRSEYPVYIERWTNDDDIPPISES